MKKKTKSLISLNDLIYIIAFCLFLFVKLLDHTTFGLPTSIKYSCIAIAIILLMTKLILQNRLCLKLLVLSIFAVIVFYISMMHNGNYQLLYTVLFIVAAKNVKFNKIVSSYIIITSIVLFLTVSAFATGLITENSTIRDGIVRHSFGYTYPTDFVALLFYLFAADLYLAVINKKGIVFRNLIYVITAFVTYRLCDSRIGSFSILLLVPLSIYLKKKYCETNVFVDKFLKFLMNYSFVICATISIVFVHGLIYNDRNPILLAIDSFSSYRLLNCLIAVKTYGYSLFGQNIYALYNATGNNEWFFIDNSYYIILIVYGLAVFAITCFVFVWRMRNLILEKKYIIPIIFILISLNSIIGQQFVLIEYNVFLLAILSEVQENTKNDITRHSS